MAEAMASALLKAVVQRLAEEAVKQYGRVKGFRSELKTVETRLSHYQYLLVDASEKEIKQVPVQKWLNKLKHLVYDIDDILDHLATDDMHREFVKNSGATTSKVRKIISSSCTCTNWSLYTKLHHRLDDINRRLEVLETEKTTIGLTVKNGGLEVTDRRPKDKNRVLQTSLVDVSRIVGRQRDKDELIDKVLGDDSRNKNFSIVPIVGMGGIGKTTLAKIVYNDERVKSHFKLKAWVCVSDEWDTFQITKTIFQYVGGRWDEKCNIFDQLQVALKDKLSEKKILLVLDDIWTLRYKDWETLVRPFSGCARGSKVIITTRKYQLLKKLLSEVDYDQLKQLECLSHDDAVSLFCQNALDAQNFYKHSTLEEHGEYFVGKCKGLPLALIALGRLLWGKDVEGWKEMRNSEIWSLEEDEEEGGGIINALKLSYHELPASLKQLFAYCSLFPKDDLFEKEGLVLLWMAEGFLHQSDHSSKTEESLGRDYFEELLSRSFFQHAPDDKSLFVMHDLMHDLSTSVAGEFFFRSEKDTGKDGKKPALEKLRHISFVREEHKSYEKFMVFKEAKHLRTFLSVGVEYRWRTNYLPNKVLAHLLPQLPFLRVINLSDYMIGEVPECIGSLKHLRYINLSRTDITRLPKTVCDLYNLQMLIVFGCYRLAKFPKNFAKLKNLRHLDIRDTPRLKGMPLGISELKTLQTLSKIIIGGQNDFSIAQLKDLQYLRGSVSILGLNKVKKATEAREANLSQKKLNELDLKWSNVSDGSIKEIDINEVLDALKPCHGDLKKLGIVNYCGLVFPKWVGDRSFLRLARVSIRGCKNCTSLPPFWQLPSLKELYIQGMDNVKFVGSEFLGDGVPFPSLEVLSFKGMPRWKEWSSNGRCNTGVVRDVFPCLKELCIENCPSLDKFSFEGDKVFPCLKELRIIYFPSLVEFSFKGNEVFSCLKVLHVKHCPRLVEVSFKGDKVFPFLQDLIIQGCSKLLKVSLEVEELPSLRVLRMDKCGNGVLRSVVRVAPLVSELEIKSISGLTNEVWRCVILDLKAVQELEIRFCDEIRYLWESKEAEASSNVLVNLRKLKVCMCENLVGFGGNLTSLTDLEIWMCPSMDVLTCGLWPPNLRELTIGKLKKPISEWGPQKFPSTVVDLTLHGQIDSATSWSELSHLHLPSSLTRLVIGHFEKLERVSEGLQHLTSLQHLTIWNCPKMKDLPETLLPSLLSLQITGCPILEKRCSKRGGAYWHKISHIPKINIR